MADSTTNIPQISSGQAQKEVRMNALTDAQSPAMLYGRDADNCSGLVFAYFGGRYQSTSIANDDVTVTDAATNYLVAAKSNGAVSVSTSTTNWNDSTNYERLYKIVAAGGVVTSYEDHRQAIGAGSAGTSFTGGTLTSALNEAPTVTIASASTVNIGAAAANTISITGTTTITAFDTIAAGAVRRVVFAGALTLTHNGTSLILPTSANITTAADDAATFLSLGSGNWKCVQYQRKSGAALVGSGGLPANFSDSSGNIAGATGARWLGDFSNATIANLTLFQSTTTNGATVLGAMPNGSSPTSALRLFGTASNVASGNVSYAQLSHSEGAATYLDSARAGSGTPVQLQIRLGTTPSVAMTIQTGGNVNIGTTTTDPGVKLNVEGAATVAGDFTVSGTGRLITADFTNATLTSAAWLQTSTANSNSLIGAKPSGSGTAASFWVADNNTPTNAGYLQMYASQAGNYIDSSRKGSGTAQALAFRMGSGFTSTIALTTAGAVSFPAVGTTASGANAYLDNGASNNLLRSTSSLRYKTDVEPIAPEFYARVLDLEPIWYRSTAPADRHEWSFYGIGAEQAAKVDPRLVQWTYADEDWQQLYDSEGKPAGRTPKEGALLVPDGVAYDRIAVLLLPIIKKQGEELAALRAEVAALKKRH